MSSDTMSTDNEEGRSTAASTVPPRKKLSRRKLFALTGRGPLVLVRAAILSANPHNSQPWLFKVTASQIDLYADRRSNLGAVDPFLREMHIGLGCALENLGLSAAANG